MTFASEFCISLRIVEPNQSLELDFQPLAAFKLLTAFLVRQFGYLSPSLGS